MDTESLATELLHEIKRSAKRWFIAFLVMVGVEICTIAGFLWYITLPVEEVEYTQEVEDIEDSMIHQIIGDDNDGTSKAESELQEKSNEK